MARQIRVSEEVYAMLWCLKPSPSTSFNDVIQELIDDVCPFLPQEIKKIQLLEDENPKLAGEELDKLHKITYENYTIDRLLRKKEREGYGKDGYY